MNILIMVPAYNEEDNIADVLSSLHECCPEYDILVVNDASTDHTSQLAKDTAYAKVIDLPYNLGIGGGIQTAFKYASKYKYDYALQFDGDGQHKVEEIGKLLQPLLNNEADVVIGSRFCEKHNGFRSSWSRRFGIRIFGLMSRLLIRQHITDCTSGFRAYNKDAIAFLAENYPVDYPEPEAVILLGTNGFVMKEVYAEMQKRQGGVSSISFFNSPYYMTKVMLGMLMTFFRRPLRS